MTTRRLVEYCACGAPLRPDNHTGVCAECRWVARNARLLASERRHQRARVVAARLKDLDQIGDKQSQPERATQ
jgi:hypothetical protein